MSRISFINMLAGLLILVLLAPAIAQEDPLREQLTAMGGIPINISAWGLTEPAFDSSTTRIGERIEELEAMLSTYRETSEISQLNRGEQLASLPTDLYRVVALALSTSAETDGAFDATVKPLVNLWKQCGREDRLPTDAELSTALASVGYGHLSLGPGQTVNFDTAGVMLDLGGIAKGYFADEAVAILRDAGATRCLVDIGGDITTWQARLTEATPFRVGIRDPRKGRGEILAVLAVPTGAVVTSGDYERYVTIQETQYCHIFDPRTGQPVTGMHSVTLLAPTGWQADALATAVFVMGRELGREFVELYPGVEAVIISDDDQDGIEVYVSPGLANSFSWVE